MRRSCGPMVTVVISTSWPSAICTSSSEAGGTREPYGTRWAGGPRERILCGSPLVDDDRVPTGQHLGEADRALHGVAQPSRRRPGRALRRRTCAGTGTVAGPTRATGRAPAGSRRPCRRGRAGAGGEASDTVVEGTGAVVRDTVDGTTGGRARRGRTPSCRESRRGPPRARRPAPRRIATRPSCRGHRGRHPSRRASRRRAVRRPACPRPPRLTTPVPLHAIFLLHLGARVSRRHRDRSRPARSATARSRSAAAQANQLGARLTRSARWSTSTLSRSSPRKDLFELAQRGGIGDRRTRRPGHRCALAHVVPRSARSRGCECRRHSPLSPDRRPVRRPRGAHGRRRTGG